MKSAIARIFTLFLFLSATGLWSCKQESENYYDEEALTEFISLGMMEAYDVFESDYLYEVILKNAGTIGGYDGCISYVSNTTDKSLTINYGTGCPGPFPLNRARSGVVMVTFPSYVGHDTATHFVGDTIATRKFTFTNYQVAGRMVEGEVDFDSVSFNTGDSAFFSRCRFKNFKITFPEGYTVTYNGVQHRNWTNGAFDSNPRNNLYILTAAKDSLAGVVTGDESFTTNIPDFVVLNYSCDKLNATSGVVEVTRLSGYPERKREVDFGDNSCDTKITVNTWRRGFPVTVD